MSVKWSPERDEIVIRGWPGGVDEHVLLVKINELPGIPIQSIYAVVSRASFLGVKRTREFIRNRIAATTAAKHEEATALALAKLEPVPPVPFVRARSPVPPPFGERPVPNPAPYHATKSISQHGGGFRMSALGGRIREMRP